MSRSDTDDNLIWFKNGVYDLKEKEFTEKEHDKKNFDPGYCDFDYVEYDENESKKLTKNVDAIFGELKMDEPTKEYMMEFMARSLQNLPKKPYVKDTRKTGKREIINQFNEIKTD